MIKLAKIIRMKFSKEQVLAALSNVEEPDLKKDLVTLNMIRDVEINKSNLCFSVMLTTPACPLKALIENACRNAISHFISPDIKVTINMTSNVTSSPKNSTMKNIKNIILVSSGKGGVGKSTVSANLALALKELGASVGLLDADIYGPSIPTMFGLEGFKPKAVTEDGKTQIFPIEKYGIKILSIGFFTEPGQPIPWRGPMVSTAVKQLFNDANWGDLDYLIVDMPPGTGDIHITVTQSFPVSGAVIVTTPQNVALADTIRGMGMYKMETIDAPLLGIIENMAWFTPNELPDNKYFIFGKDGGKNLAEKFDIPYLGGIPIVEEISNSGDAGAPIMLNKNSNLHTAFSEIAQRVAQQIAIVNAERSQTLITN